MKNITIQNLVLGSIATNCMLIINQDTKQAVIVDPADSPELISEAVTRFGIKPEAILLTHGHYDHMLAANDVRDIYEIPVYAYEEEQDVLEDPAVNLSGSWSSGHTTKADLFLKDRQQLTLAGMQIRVLHTPGHTKGSCCYYFPEGGFLISGDTLFAGSVGRMDFPTSSGAQMKASIKKLMAEIPEETDVYPGHGEATTIGYEKRYNPFA